MKALFYCFSYFLLGFASLFAGSELEDKSEPLIKEAPTFENKLPVVEEFKLLEDDKSKDFNEVNKESESFEVSSKIDDGGCQPLELTLEKVFCIIESENLTVLLNRERIEQALQEAYIRRADLFPQIGLNVSQTRANVITTGNSLGSQIAIAQSINDFDATLDANFAIFDLTKIAGYQSAKMGWKISALNYNAILQDILTEAGKLYYLHIRNLKALDVTDVNLREAKVLLDLAKARFEAGVSSPIDVTKAEVQIAIYQRDRLNQEVIIKTSELELKRMLDIDAAVPITVAYSSSDDPRPKPEIEKPALQEVLGKRFDYLTACVQLKRNIYDQKAASWAAYPQITAIGNWGYGSQLPFDGNMLQEWTVGIGLTMPVFDGFRIRSNVLQKGSLVRQQQANLVAVANQINTQLSLNSYALEIRYSEIDLTRKQVSLGQQELDLAKTRFKEGVADNTDIVLAQTNLATFMDNLVNILYLYDNARLEWARTLGDVRYALCDGH